MAEVVAATIALIDGPPTELQWEASPEEKLYISFHDDLAHVSMIRQNGVATNWFIPTSNIACLELTETGVELPPEWSQD